MWGGESPNGDNKKKIFHKKILNPSVGEPVVGA